MEASPKEHDEHKEMYLHLQEYLQSLKKGPSGQVRRRPPRAIFAHIQQPLRLPQATKTKSESKQSSVSTATNGAQRLSVSSKSQSCKFLESHQVTLSANWMNRCWWRPFHRETGTGINLWVRR